MEFLALYLLVMLVEKLAAQLNTKKDRLQGHLNQFKQQKPNKLHLDGWIFFKYSANAKKNKQPSGVCPWHFSFKTSFVKALFPNIVRLNVTGLKVTGQMPDDILANIIAPLLYFVPRTMFSAKNAYRFFPITEITEKKTV